MVRIKQATSAGDEAGSCRKTGRVAATVRVMPDHPSLPHPFVPGLFLQG